MDEKKEEKIEELSVEPHTKLQDQEQLEEADVPIPLNQKSGWRVYKEGVFFLLSHK